MSSSCTKCGTGCKCGSDCKCTGCSCCKRNVDFGEEGSAAYSGTVILGVAPLKGQFEEGGEEGEEKGGCMCGSNCSCDPCTC